MLNFTLITKQEVINLFLLTEEDVNGVEILYAAKSDESAYVLYRKGNEVYEVKGREWKPLKTSVFGIVKRAMVHTPEFYSSLPGFLSFLQELQKATPSIVERIITECKGYDQQQLREWYSTRTDEELEELYHFGLAVASFAEDELDKRREMVEVEDDKEEFYQ